MLSFEWTRGLSLFASIGLMVSLSACTVEPLNASRATAVTGQNAAAPSTGAVLQTISVEPVFNRVAQQVRNNLLFELNGGKPVSDSRYLIKLNVASSSRSLAIESASLSPTAAQSSITVDFQLVDTTNGNVITQGKRRAVASFDKTPQSYANERAEREAQNRAAKDVAIQIRLSVAQSLSST